MAAQTSDPAPANRRFRVRARHHDVHHARVLLEPTAHAAAIAFVEHLPVSAAERDGVSLVVHDLETGHEQSFWVHVDGDDVAAEP